MSWIVAGMNLTDRWAAFAWSPWNPKNWARVWGDWRVVVNYYGGLLGYVSPSVRRRIHEISQQNSSENLALYEQIFDLQGEVAALKALRKKPRGLTDKDWQKTIAEAQATPVTKRALARRRRS